MIPILLHRAYRRAAAVRNARGDHDGVALVDHDAAAFEFLVQHLEGELDRTQHIVAPVLFRVLLRMRMLEGESVWRCRIERRPRAARDGRREVRIVARLFGIGALAPDQVHCVVLQIMCAGAGAFVRVGDGAAVLKAPFPGGRDRAVDAARAGRRRRDDATRRRHEAVRYLNHHGDAIAPVPAPLEGDVFVARDQALARCHRAVCHHVRAIKRAVATTRRRIDQGAVIVVDREPAQFLGRGIERIDEAGRCRRA